MHRPIAPANSPRHTRHGVEVVFYAVEAAPTQKRLPIPIEVALRAVLPCHPASLHDPRAVEVVPGTAYLLTPLHRLPIGAVVVFLAADGQPLALRRHDVERDRPRAGIGLPGPSNFVDHQTTPGSKKESHEAPRHLLTCTVPVCGKSCSPCKRFAAPLVQRADLY